MGIITKIGGLLGHLIVHDPVLTELQTPQRIASLTPLDDVLVRINALVKPIAAQRIDDLRSALGRTAAEDIIIDAPVPPAAIALSCAALSATFADTTVPSRPGACVAYTCNGILY